MMPATLDLNRRTDPATFVERHQRGVLRWLRALGCEPDRAEEHCQDALLAALQHAVHERDDTVAGPWLRTAARNLFWMRLRRERRQPPVLALDEVEAAWLTVHADRDGGDAALVALRACLEAADPRDREVLQRRYGDGASRVDMAEALGIGEAGVKQALRRARLRMQHCVESRLGAVGEEGR